MIIPHYGKTKQCLAICLQQYTTEGLLLLTLHMKPSLFACILSMIHCMTFREWTGYMQSEKAVGLFGGSGYETNCIHLCIQCHDTVYSSPRWCNFFKYILDLYIENLGYPTAPAGHLWHGQYTPFLKCAITSILYSAS